MSNVGNKHLLMHGTQFTSNKPMNAKREHILQIAVKMASTAGLKSLTRDSIASTAGVSNGSINHYFDNIDRLRTMVIRHAVKAKILRIVGEAIAQRHPVALGAPRALRNEALASLGQ